MARSFASHPRAGSTRRHDGLQRGLTSQQGTPLQGRAQPASPEPPSPSPPVVPPLVVPTCRQQATIPSRQGIGNRRRSSLRFKRTPTPFPAILLQVLNPRPLGQSLYPLELGGPLRIRLRRLSIGVSQEAM